MPKKNPFQMLGDWWGVIIIVVGVLGGYIWLDKTYTRINSLMEEKCNLSYTIAIMKAEIEFDILDEKIVFQQNEYTSLTQMPNSSAEEIEFIDDYIKRLTSKSKKLAEYIKCLHDQKAKCYQGEFDTDKCSK